MPDRGPRRGPDLGTLARDRAGAAWCLFVDRDGVVNRRVEDGYVRSWEEFDFLPGAVEALAGLAAWASQVVVVTNQQGVGKGAMSHADLDDVHARMVDALAAAGARVDGVLVCPHLAADRCDCRKPEPGLARGWLDRHPALDAALSVMVGDAGSDMEMAHRLGAATGGCVALGIGDPPGADLGFGSLAELGEHLSTYLEGAVR